MSILNCDKNCQIALMGEYLGFNQWCLFSGIISILNVCPSEQQKMICGFNLHSFHYSRKHLLMPHQTLLCVCVHACVHVQYKLPIHTLLVFATRFYKILQSEK